MTDLQIRQILSVHLPNGDGFCSGCRRWWARLVPYPCPQTEWAARQQARTAVRRFLDGRP
ncbi:hypothetical protein AB0H28_20315 [Micromonospora sp. NPDC050980]|uniref:hypothetical protein n=1 Tax=Micromonospora sp. NPDC050980 TaxID=3155161 RepID=UPI0033D73C49